MTLPIKLILLLCLSGCFPPCQAVSDDYFDLQATYVRYNKNYLPFTLFHDGKSLIVYDGDAYHYYSCIEDVFTSFDYRLKRETFYGYGQYPDNKRRTISFDTLYRLLPSPWAVDVSDIDFDKLPDIITNNPSPDFMADVRYRQYTLAEQDKVPKVYRDYIRRRAQTDGLDNTPIIIKELWEFDFDGDGKNEAFIVANNSAEYYGYQEQEPTYEVSEPETLSAEGGVGFYSYNLFYSETFLPIDFEAVFGTMRDIFFPKPEQVCDIIAPIYEYDKQGKIRLYDTWWGDDDELYLMEDDCPPPSAFRTTICDLNGDGLYDFFILNYTGIYAPYQIYIQHPDGYFFRLGGVNTLA